MDGDANDGWEKSGDGWGEDVPLTGEDGSAPIFPESVNDGESLTHVRVGQAAKQRAEDQRNHFRWKRRTAILDRLVLLIVSNSFVRRIVPHDWLEVSTESGERYPRFVTFVRDSISHWWRGIVGAASFVASTIFILQWLLGAPSSVVADGTHVVNLWAPNTPYTMDFTSPKVSDWLTEHKTKAPTIRVSDLNAEYFAANVYHAGETRNITIPWLTRALKDACHYEDEDEHCTCLAAVELGVFANVVNVNTFIMFNPHVTAKSEGTHTATFGDGTQASYPDAIIVEYLHSSGSDGKVTRYKASGNDAYCIMRALDLVGDV